MKIVDWGREVMAGWVRATVLQGDPEWARELFAWDPLADLLAALPPPSRRSSRPTSSGGTAWTVN
ncbi:hypothetical protein ACFQX6_63245 [Streptosporangium lutulentum]